MIEFLIAIPSFLVAISILVAVHEYGHFWMARRMGIKVLRFSIGFGKVLWSRRGADGTEYAFSAIPLGGYVKLLDEREAPVEPSMVSQAYNQKPVWRRILVLLAGPFANFLFAVFAYWILFVVGTPAIKPVVGDVAADSIAARAGLKSGDAIVGVGGEAVTTQEGAMLGIVDRVMGSGSISLQLVGDKGAGESREVTLAIAGDRRALTEPGALLPGLGFDFWRPGATNEIGKVEEGSPAARAGLQVGDRIVAIDGAPVAAFADLQRLVEPRPGQTLTVTVERGQQPLDFRVEAGARRDGDRLVGRIGVGPARSLAMPESMKTVERANPVAALGIAIDKTWAMSALTVRMIWKVITGDVSAKNLSGPISIAEYAGYSAQQGIITFLSFLAVVSVSLFVLNLLPIPVLDGGQVVYQVAELVKGSPLSERAQALGQQVGLLVLLMLMSLAFYNDLAPRFFS